MAVISMDYHDLVSLIGQDLSMEELLNILPMMGSDIDSVDGDVLNVEFFPNRPDLYSVEGVARALRGFIGKEKGLPEYELGKSGIVLNVDASVNDVRPFIVAGVVRNVEMTDELIKSLMEVQEKLHLTLGRKRKKVAIGVHDSRSLVPPFVYKAIDPESLRFVPLGHYDEMDLADILVKHEKGVEYAWTLEGLDRYPIILDAEDKVLSFPPIINGMVTQVTEATTDLFLDLTGMDFNAINTALNVISTLLAERGGKIETVDVVYPDNTFTLPNLKPIQRFLAPSEVNSLLGTAYDPEHIVDFLQRMRFGAALEGETISVQVPAYRNDILHNVDMIEDIAIGAGYGNIIGVLPKALTFGNELEVEKFSNLVRELMLGYGYTEVKSLTLSSEHDQFTQMRRPESDGLVEIVNPISEDLTCTRVTITPSIFRFFQANKHRDLPQSVFEVGDVLKGKDNHRHLAALTVHSKASFTEMKSLVQSVLRDLGCEFSLAQIEDGAYVPGRCAGILVEGAVIGSFGEFHPHVIHNFELGYPVAGFELSLKSFL
jgi:phenylalanyl-tRNA synthetase beta chain